MWPKTITRMPRLKALPAPMPGSQTIAIAAPLCRMAGGLCDSLLSVVPMCIVGIQFIRDTNDMVKDGLVIFSNHYADNILGGGTSLIGARFLQDYCDKAMPGLWQRCLWVATSGHGEIVIESDTPSELEPGLLSIAPYGDGLIICRSINVDKFITTRKDNGTASCHEAPRHNSHSLTKESQLTECQ
jgi:hypothetical protein